MKTFIIIIVLALLAWGGYVLFGRDGAEVAIPTDNQTQTYLTPPSQSATSTATSTSTSSPTVLPETKSFTVVGSNFRFTPAAMTVNRGDRVRITFQNQSGTHDWVLDQFNARTKVLQGGQSETIEFVANQSGSFEYYCSVGNHRQMGMVGTLTVK